jgi:hypothetical protein
MRVHSMVKSFKRIDVPGEIVYEITRHIFDDTVRVWLSDAYRFTEMDFINRPSALKAGDFILIAKPEANGFFESDDETQIGMGKIGELMGALNVREMWTYEPPTDEQRRLRRERFRKRKS